MLFRVKAIFLQPLDTFASISSFVNLSLIFRQCFGFIQHALKPSINAPDVIITSVKKYTVFWGKANTVTRVISYTFSSLFSKYHIRGRKERVCRGGEDPYTQPTKYIQFSLILITVFLLLHANTARSPTNSASNTRLWIVGAVQKGKETKYCLEINNSPPTKHFKVKCCENLYSWLWASYEVCFAGASWCEGPEDPQDFYLDNKAKQDLQGGRILLRPQAITEKMCLGHTSLFSHLKKQQASRS